MVETDAARERAAARLRQRLWGAAVLIALAVIGLPLLLDGAGSESRFRRVERLREEPPRIVGSSVATDAPPIVSPDGSPDAPAGVAPYRSADDLAAASARRSPDAAVVAPPGAPPESASVALPDASPSAPSAAPRLPPGTRSRLPERPRAWVVQAGSFREQTNAVTVRDRLRREGYASFVTDASDVTGAPLFRVNVGPLVDEMRITVLRDEIAALLGGEAIVVVYP